MRRVKEGGGDKRAIIVVVWVRRAKNAVKMVTKCGRRVRGVCSQKTALKFVQVSVSPIMHGLGFFANTGLARAGVPSQKH